MRCASEPLNVTPSVRTPLESQVLASRLYAVPLLYAVLLYQSLPPEE
ncbi:MAG: hypothetical protein QM756_09020 [Polyangiaceae bacterium]